MIRRLLMATALVSALSTAASTAAWAEPSSGAPLPSLPASAAAMSSAPGGNGNATEGVVNLNAATEEQLGFLPGVGSAKAQAIIEHRRTHPFHRVDELTKVKGIGKKTFARLRPFLTVAGPTTLAAEVKLRR